MALFIIYFDVILLKTIYVMQKDTYFLCCLTKYGLVIKRKNIPDRLIYIPNLIELI